MLEVVVAISSFQQKCGRIPGASDSYLTRSVFLILPILIDVWVILMNNYVNNLFIIYLKKVSVGLLWLNFIELLYHYLFWKVLFMVWTKDFHLHTDSSNVYRNMCKIPLIYCLFYLFFYQKSSVLLSFKFLNHCKYCFIYKSVKHVYISSVYK